jgi:hypothetical protein
MESDGLDGEDDSDEFDPSLAPQDDLIKRVANIVRYIRSSGTRKAEFTRLVELCLEDPELRKDPEFIGAAETKKRRPLELKLHVRTRWDSVYQMLVRFRFLKKVSARVRTSNELSALTLGIQAVVMYFANNASIQTMELSATDWKRAEALECVLWVCSQILFAHHIDGSTLQSMRLHMRFCKLCRLNRRRSCVVLSLVLNFS